MKLAFKDSEDRILFAVESDQVPDTEDVVEFPDLSLHRVQERRWDYVGHGLLQVNLLVSPMTD